MGRYKVHIKDAKRCISVVLLWLASCTGILQANPVGLFSYDIKNFNDEAGLPQNTVDYIAKDEAGYIWLATQNGLVRFDGTNFRIWLRDELKTSSDRIRTLFRDVHGKGLYAITPNYEVIEISGGWPRLLPKKEKHFWEYLNGEEHPINFYPVGNATFWKVENNSPSFLTRINAREYVAFKGRTLIFYKDERQAGTCDLEADREILAYSQSFVIGNELFAYTKDKNIVKITPQGIVRIQLEGDIRRHDVGKECTLWAIANEQLAGHSFLATCNSLYLVDTVMGNKMHTRLILDNFPMDRRTVRSVYYDEKTGMLLLGSLSKGFFQLKPKRFKTLTSDDGATDIYYSQLELSPGEIFVGDGKILSVNKKEQELSPEAKSLDPWSLIRDQSGHIWGKRSHIVYKMDGRLKQLLASYNLTGVITAMGYDPYKNKIYVANSSRNKIFELDADQNVQEAKPVCDIFHYVICMMQINDTSLFIGTEKGLYRYNSKKGLLYRLKGSEDLYVRSIYQSPANKEVIWVTTEGQGIMKYEQGRLMKMPLDKSEYLRYAHAILEDERSFFWISTNKGLFKVSRKDLESYEPGKTRVFYKYFSKENGFNSNEFNGGGMACAIKLSDGHFSFSSMQGLVLFRPEEIPDILPAGDIFIDKIINGNTRLSARDTIVWVNKEEPLSISISTPYFGSPEDVKFIYKASKHGPAETNNGQIHFTSLPVGRHYLQISMASRYGADNITSKTIIVDVLPYWYETWWFYFGVTALVLLSVYIGVELRLLNLENRNLRLEDAIRERTIELEDAVHTLEESENKLNNELYFQQSLNSNITHNIKTPLRYLMLSIGKLNEQLQQSGNASVSEQAARIYSSVQELYHNTDQFVTYMKAVGKSGVPATEDFRLYLVVDELVRFFNNLIPDKSIEIENGVDSRLTMIAPLNLLRVILHNFIDNALKHSGSRVIIISSELEENELKVVIRDFGKGMHPVQVDRINNYLSMKGHEKADTGMDIGMGFFIVKEMLPYLQGKAAVYSQPDGGTTVVLIFKNYYLR